MGLVKGRPRITEEQHAYNREQVKQLAAIGSTGEEICSALEIGRETLYKHYGTQLKEGRWLLVKSLKRKQVELALGGDRTMLIWLGKQYCGQSDKHEVNGDAPALPIESQPPTIIVEFVEGSAPNADHVPRLDTHKELPPPQIIRATGTAPIK